MSALVLTASENPPGPVKRRMPYVAIVLLVFIVVDGLYAHSVINSCLCRWLVVVGGSNLEVVLTRLETVNIDMADGTQRALARKYLKFVK